MPDAKSSTWGVIPAAGRGSRIQPLGFSKELLPVGSREGGSARPCAVAEYLVERMVRGGADKLCFVIAPGKSDILEYFGAACAGAPVAYVVQPDASGLCDALFRAEPLLGPADHVIVGLPDTVWFPEDALRALPDGRLSFLLFPVDKPQLFDAVTHDEAGRVREIRVKSADPQTNWVWGAFKMPAATFRDLRALWLARQRRDEFVGTLVNAYLAQGSEAWGVRAGSSYVDVGTLDGYRDAIRTLARHESERRDGGEPRAIPSSSPDPAPDREATC